MNQHYEFWVKYYECLQEHGKMDKAAADRQNDRIIKNTWERSEDEIPLQEQSLCFRIGYPGLLCGLGYQHAIGNDMKREQSDEKKAVSDIGLGFLFDTVTGLPYIPGSAVKGLLRSAFIQNIDYVCALLEDAGVSMNAEQLHALEISIFGTAHPHDPQKALKKEESVGQDCFLDAWPISPNQKGRLMGIENITPHRADDIEYDGLCSPVPLNLLKILPDVTLQLRYMLKDTILADGLKVDAATKLKLFSSLLCDLGIGAKTNAGFGVLICAEDVKDAKYLRIKEDASHPMKQNNSAAQRTSASVSRRTQDSSNTVISTVRSKAEIKEGMYLRGQVNGIKDGLGAFVTLLPGVSALVHISQISKERVEDVRAYLSVGQEVVVKVVSSFKPGQIALSIKQVPEGMRNG